jgi:hypothetical protein
MQAFEHVESPLGQAEISISDEAISRLEEMHLDDTEIADLLETIQLYAFDDPVARAEQLQKSGMILKVSDRPEILLPGFFQIGARRTGEGFDLSASLLKQLQDGGFLNTVNEMRSKEGLPRLALVTGYGRSPKFFNRSSARHYFLGIVEEGKAPRNPIIIDPAFGVITEQQDSGYNQDVWYARDQIETQEITGTVSVVDSQDIEAAGYMSSLTLGLSANHNYMYYLGWCHAPEADGPGAKEEIKPFLEIGDQDGELRARVFLTPQGEIGYSYPETVEEINGLNQAEVIEVLKRLNEMRPKLTAYGSSAANSNNTGALGDDKYKAQQKGILKNPGLNQA